MVLNQRLTQSDRGARCRAHARLLRELWHCHPDGTLVWTSMLLEILRLVQRHSLDDACAPRETTISVCVCTTCRGVVMSNQRRNLKPNICETALFVKGFWRSDAPPPGGVGAYYAISPKHFMPPPLTQRIRWPSAPKPQPLTLPLPTKATLKETQMQV